MNDDCVFCDEPVRGNASRDPVWTEEGPRMVHIECSLREVMGGIGHLIAHEYWCTQEHDPDAGLTRRQSALLVAEYVKVVGVENAVRYSGR